MKHKVLAIFWLVLALWNGFWFVYAMSIHSYWWAALAVVSGVCDLFLFDWEWRK